MKTGGLSEDIYAAHSSRMRGCAQTPFFFSAFILLKSEKNLLIRVLKERNIFKLVNLDFGIWLIDFVSLFCDRHWRFRTWRRRVLRLQKVSGDADTILMGTPVDDICRARSPFSENNRQDLLLFIAGLHLLPNAPLFFIFPFFPFSSSGCARESWKTDRFRSFLFICWHSFLFFFLPHLLDIFIFINIYQYPCASDAQFMWKMVVLIE